MNIFNTTSGVSIGSLASDVDDAYGLFKNGLFKKTKNSIGTFIHKVSDIPDTMGVEETCEISFERDESIPKIPYQIFQSILKFYKDVYKDIKSEVYTLIVWDKVNKDFFIHVPHQEVSGATVKYTNNVEIYNNPDYLVYCDFHSHNTMNAFFSSTDTKDEVAGRYFGVIGKIFDERPAMALKASFNRQGVLLNYQDLFDIETEKLHPNSNYYLDYDSIKDRIKERTYTYPIYGGYKGSPLPKSSTGTKPKNVSVVSSRRNKKFGNKNLVTHNFQDNYDYDDDAAWADLQRQIDLDESADEFKLLDYLDQHYNLSKDTMFEQNPVELQAFVYDFKKIFKAVKGETCTEKDVINIFQSLFELVFSYNDLDSDAFDSIIKEVSLTYANFSLESTKSTTVLDTKTDTTIPLLNSLPTK